MGGPCALAMSPLSEKDLGDALRIFDSLSYVREQDIPSIPVLPFRESRPDPHPVRGLVAGGGRYAAGDGASSQKLSVNGATPTTVAYPKTAAWGTFPAGQVVVLDVALRKGRNSLKFTKGDGFAELDRIDLVRHAGSVLRLGGFDKSPNSGYDSASDALVLGASSSATYENVGFDSGAFKSVELCAISGTGRVKLSLAASTSPSEILDVSGKGCQTFDLGAAFQTTKGIQDLVVANVTGDLVLESLRFQQSSTGVARPETARPLSPQRRPFDVLGRLDRNPYPYGAGRLEMVP